MTRFIEQYKENYNDDLELFFDDIKKLCNDIIDIDTFFAHVFMNSLAYI